MLFPNELWKFILSFNSIICEQHKHCESILSYYENHSTLGELPCFMKNRDILSRLIEKALRYPLCVKYLIEKDNNFQDAITEYRENRKTFRLMNDMESLLTHIWMLKFH